MGYWVKHFIDGTSLVGDDQDVRAGKVSWSKSNLSNLASVSLHHGVSNILIAGANSNFWQGDTYETIMLQTNSAQLIRRSISREILPQDLFFTVSHRPHKLGVSFNQDCPTGYRVDVKEEWYHKWIVLQIDTRSMLTKYTIQDKQI